MTPVALLLVLYYFDGQEPLFLSGPRYAPAITAQAVGPTAGIIYATAAGLGAWDIGRAKQGMVFAYPTVRREFRTAFQFVLPTFILTTLMIVLPCALALRLLDVAPTLSSVETAMQQIVIGGLYAALGVMVGLWLPRMIAAPVLAALVYFFTTFSVASSAFWIRNVSGYYYDPLFYGELPIRQALVAPALWTLGLAAAAAALWLLRRRMTLAIVLACVAGAVGTGTAYGMARDFGPSIPVTTGSGPEHCEGKKPRVCVPLYATADVPGLRREIDATLGRLRTEGILATVPSTVRDTVLDGRQRATSTPDTWRIRLTIFQTAAPARPRDLHYSLAMAATSLPCSRPNAVQANVLAYVTAEISGAGVAFRKDLDAWKARDPKRRSHDTQAITQQMQAALDLTPVERSAWIDKTARSACS